MGLAYSGELEWLRNENAELKASLQSAMNLVQIAPAFVGILSREGRLLDLNDRALDVIESRRRDVIGRYFWECGWWKNLSGSALQVQEALTQALDHKTSRIDVEYWSTRAGVGERRWVAMNVAPIPSMTGEVSKIAVSGIDITERKVAESALIFERQQLETIFQQSPAAIALWRGPDFIFEKVNSHFQSLFLGRKLLGRSFLEACPEFVDQPFPKLLSEVLESGIPYEGREVLAMHADMEGSEIREHYYDFSYMRVNDADGKAYGVYVNAIDVTDRVLDRRRLEKAKLEADQANSSKTSFLANMSHEIRTPMTAVLGFTELLRESSLSEDERQNALSRIEKSGRALLKIIDDILDITKVEAGKLSVERAVFSPRELTSEIAAFLRLQAEQKKLVLKTRFDPSVPATAQCDSSRLRQIITNLVSNAIKFTARGEVTIEVSAEHDSETQIDSLVFDVVDTGIGIAQRDQRKLFQPFAQADDSITRNFGGTGLGLVLSKRLSQQLGGDLYLVSSEISKGSRFRVKVEAGPFDSTHAATWDEEDSDTELEPLKPEIVNIRLDSCRVLVVDDVLDNQLLMRIYLEGAGAKVDVASDGEQAVLKAAVRRYDVVLMDIQMPNLDGIEATKSLRARGYDGPILALTAHALSDHVNRSLMAGCNEHLTKPITKKRLLGVVKKYAAISQASRHV